MRSSFTAIDQASMLRDLRKANPGKTLDQIQAATEAQADAEAKVGLVALGVIGLIGLVALACTASSK
jgi:hypothetical protein